MLCADVHALTTRKLAHSADKFSKKKYQHRYAKFYLDRSNLSYQYV